MSNKIGKRLRKLRGDRTQAQVADDLGISQSALSTYENDERIPRDRIKVKIADFYKRSVQFIFFN